MQNLNEKSKVCCEACLPNVEVATGVVSYSCRNEFCECHKPSVTESEENKFFTKILEEAKPYADEFFKTVVTPNLTPESTLRIEKQVGYYTDSISSGNSGSVKTPPYSTPESVPDVTPQSTEVCNGCDDIIKKGENYCSMCKKHFDSTEMEELDIFIRDVCSVVPKSKSEVRRKLNNLLSSHSQKLVSELKEKIHYLPRCHIGSTKNKVWYIKEEDVINLLK